MRQSALLLGLCALLPAAASAQHPASHGTSHGTSNGSHALDAKALRAAIAASPAASKAVAAKAAPRVVTVVTHEYAFEAPASISAGPTTFRVVNKGKELHHVWLVRLDQGKTAQDYMKALEALAKGEAPPPAWATDMGGPQMGMPGALADATIDLAEGSYVIVCHIPAADGMPHSAKGMIKPLTVTAATATPVAASPKADLTMALRDYDFVLSSPLTAGRHTVRIVNEAEQFHEAFIVRLVPGKKAADVPAWIEGGMKGPPPMMLVGGTSGLSKGRDLQFTADFAPGEYALVCFLPDFKDGKPHVAHGMIKQITVAPAGKKAQTAAR
jgi:hypothetical protein